MAWVCGECSCSSFRYVEEYLKHKELHEIECKICDIKFKTRQAYGKHLKTKNHSRYLMLSNSNTSVVIRNGKSFYDQER